MEIKRVGVVGAGVMGTGVAQNLCMTGHDVVLIDISEVILGHALDKIRQDLRMAAFFNKEACNLNIDEIMNHITTAVNLEFLKDVDFIVENVVERWDVKNKVYSKLDEICKPDCIFAVNTSCISITRIGGVTKRPDKIVGTHFMNPVPLKKTVEVIRGFHTSDSTISTTRQFLLQMGKDCVVVNDMPGFVSNRVLMLMVNEAAFVVQDQVASAEDVDKIFRDCFGHKMGPLETGDLIGLDTILYSLEVLYESYNDSKFRPCPLLKKMVYAGLLGCKSGKGFYEYPI